MAHSQADRQVGPTTERGRAARLRGLGDLGVKQRKFQPHGLGGTETLCKNPRNCHGKTCGGATEEPSEHVGCETPMEPEP